MDLYGHLMPDLFGHCGGRMEKVLNDDPLNRLASIRRGLVLSGCNGRAWEGFDAATPEN